MINKTVGPAGTLLFDYTTTPNPSSRSSRSSSASSDLTNYDPLTRPSKKHTNGTATALDSKLEGYDADPNLTKVVDRRWYERNKHIFPASVWEEFDPGKDYSRGVKKDAEGNAFFFT